MLDFSGLPDDVPSQTLPTKPPVGVGTFVVPSDGKLSISIVVTACG